MAENLKVKSTLAVGTEVSEYTWDNVSYKQLTKMQRRLANIGLKLVEAGQDHAEGKKTAGFSDDKSNPMDFKYRFDVTKQDGKYYHHMELGYTNIPEADTEWMKGLLSGELREWEGSAKKQKRVK